MNVCATCGIVAPRPGLPCEGCGSTGTGRAPERRGGAYFVWIRCRFQCRGCGRLAPLDEIEVGGVARCVLCGLTQAFDPSAWREALAFAHGVGDLAGGEGLHPDARWAIGLANPHAEIGITRASTPLVVSGTGTVGGVAVSRSLHVRAAPGHPLCGTCRSPLQVDRVAEGQLQARCAECGASARYDVSAAVVAACHGLRGVMSEGGRAGLQEARTVREAGVVGLSCPGCGAPLRATGAARTVECAFCHLVSRVPGELAATGEDREPAALWLLLSGPSAARRALLQGGDGAAAFRAVPELPTSFWRSFLPSAVVAGGMTGVVGLLLFVLLRSGIVPLEAILSP